MHVRRIAREVVSAGDVVAHRGVETIGPPFICRRGVLNWIARCATFARRRWATQTPDGEFSFSGLGSEKARHP